MYYYIPGQVRAVELVDRTLGQDMVVGAGRMFRHYLGMLAPLTSAAKAVRTKLAPEQAQQLLRVVLRVVVGFALG